MKLVKNGIGAVRNFLKETRAEAKKVVWPGRQYVAVATTIILFIVLVSALYVIVLDSIFARIFGYLMKLV